MKQYITDTDGVLIRIEDFSLIDAIGWEEYNKWQTHNDKRVAKGLIPIEYEEYREGLVLLRGDQIKRNEEIELKKEWKEKNLSEIAILIDEELGSFTFLNYKNTLKMGLEPQYLYRFVILCCYMDYDNSIRYGNGKEGSNYATEKDLEEIWKLSKRETINTKKALIEYDLLRVEGGRLYINPLYCRRGQKVKKISKTYLKGSVKMFRDGLLELNEKVDAKQHKRMALFVQLLPYVNYHYNILCSNPNESDLDKVKPLTPKDMCKLVGYDEKHSSRLIKELSQLKINNRYAIAIVLRDGMSKKHIYINPFIYCKTNDAEKLRGIITMFKIEEDKK